MQETTGRGADTATTEACVTIGLQINGHQLRGMMDSGASRSVIDIGTLEIIGMTNAVQKDESIELWDASSKKMNVLGRCTLEFNVPKLEKTFEQEFTVLNIKSYKTLLLGRDFFEKVGAVTIDVKSNKIKLGKKWIKGDEPKKRLRVNTRGRITIPARSEQFICVGSKQDAVMLDYEFFPAKIIPTGVYVGNARVKPDMNGEFVISVLNVNEHDVTLKARTRMGDIFPSVDERLCRVAEPMSNDSDAVDKVNYGENLNVNKNPRYRPL